MSSNQSLWLKAGVFGLGAATAAVGWGLFSYINSPKVSFLRLTIDGREKTNKEDDTPGLTPEQMRSKIIQLGSTDKITATVEFKDEASYLVFISELKKDYDEGKNELADDTYYPPKIMHCVRFRWNNKTVDTLWFNPLSLS